MPQSNSLSILFVYHLFFSIILLFPTSIAFGQDTTLDTKCWRGICKTYANHYSECYVTDSLGQILIPKGYDDIQFFDSRNFLLVIRKRLKGIVNLANQTVIPVEFDDISMRHDAYFVTRSANNLISLYDTLGHRLLPPGQWKLKIESCPITYIFAIRDSLYHIYDHKGQLLIDFGVKSFDRFRYAKQDCFRITLQNGHQCLLGLHDLIDRLSIEYQSIIKPKGYEGVTILTWLPNEKGEVFKQCVIERIVTDPIYIEICFEPDCIDSFRKKIRYDYIRPKIFYGIGILPDMSLHLFNTQGRIIETVSHP